MATPEIVERTTTKQLSDVHEAWARRVGWRRSYSYNAKPETRPTTLRPCMTCGETFESQGNHNRMCRRCRAMRVSPMEP